MRKIFLLLVLLTLTCCASEKFGVFNKQDDDIKVEIPKNCYSLPNYFRYDSTNNLQYISEFSPISNGNKHKFVTLNTNTDDAILNTLLNACEICEEEYPEYLKYKEKILELKEQKEKIEEKVAKDMEELRKEREERDNKEKLREQREKEKIKANISQKYGYEWCYDENRKSNNRCILEGEFRIFEQLETGTLVKPYVSRDEILMMTGLSLIFSDISTANSLATGEPDEFNNVIDDWANEMQQLVFIESNPKDSNQIDGARIKGLFLRDGVYKYQSLAGTKTVKKLRRLE